MNREYFVRCLDAWIYDFRTEAIAQFDRGVPVNAVLTVARAVADNRAIAKDKAEARQAGHPAGVFFGLFGLQ